MNINKQENRRKPVFLLYTNTFLSGMEIRCYDMIIHLNRGVIAHAGF